jgi:O-antigen/teichoic acid export membrane protein
MSRQAREDPPALKRNYGLAIKLLVSTALPIAVLFTFLAEALTYLLGGAEFLPDGAIATQLMIWSIPIGWINSITNYVLIALNRQRVLTWTFVLGVIFNVGANLYFIPRYSYPAAAIITIASELVLLAAFYVVLASALRDAIQDGRRAVVPWLRILWRPVVAGALMAGVTWGLAQIGNLLALLGGTLVYAVTLLLLHPLDADEQASIAPLLPARLRRQPAPRADASPDTM